MEPAQLARNIRKVISRLIGPEFGPHCVARVGGQQPAALRTRFLRSDNSVNSINADPFAQELDMARLTAERALMRAFVGRLLEAFPRCILTVTCIKCAAALGPNPFIPLLQGTGGMGERGGKCCRRMVTLEPK